MADALMRFVLLFMVEPMERISECFERGLRVRYIKNRGHCNNARGAILTQLLVDISKFIPLHGYCSARSPCVIIK